MLCFWSGGYTKSSAGARLIVIIIMLTRQNFNELRMLSSITMTYSRQNAMIIVWRGPFWEMRAGDQKLLFLLEWLLAICFLQRPYFLQCLEYRQWIDVCLTHKVGLLFLTVEFRGPRAVPFSRYSYLYYCACVITLHTNVWCRDSRHSLLDTAFDDSLLTKNQTLNASSSLSILDCDLYCDIARVGAKFLKASNW